MAYPIEMTINAVRQYRGLADASLRAVVSEVIADLSRDPLRGQSVVVRGLRSYTGGFTHASGVRSFTIECQFRIGEQNVTINSIIVA